ncbi:MAG: metal ABC transporter ATP-binding protein [Phycisphaerales bacterium]
MPNPTQTPALEFVGVSYAYPGAAVAGTKGGVGEAIRGVTLDVRVGERVGILGPNGGGKSTLLKIALGLLDGYEGKVSVFGRPPSVARREGLVGYVPQRVEAELGLPVSARQVVQMAATVGMPAWRPSGARVRTKVDECLSMVGASDFASQAVGKLSGGQLQRVMIARALAREPRMLMLDEPTVGIDAAGQQRFSALIERLNKGLGLTIVVVSHDLRTIATSCDRVACLRRTLHYHDAPGGLTPAVLAEVFSHDIEAVFGEVHIDAHAAADCHDPTHHHHHAHDHGGGGQG